jgi:hypothetical protein
MVYRLLADGVAGIHYAYLVYLLVGGFVAWRWPWTIVGHIVAAIWGVLIIATPVPCPLTAAQNALRNLGGEPTLPRSFIDIYVRGTLYPAAHETETQALIAGIVIVSWIGFVVRLRAKRDVHGRLKRDLRERIKRA